MRRARHLLVLGLDHTLMYAGALPLAREPDFRLLDYCAYLRPHLQEFLLEAFVRFTVGVWSTAPAKYTRLALHALLPSGLTPLFVWNAAHCSEVYDPDLCDRVPVKRLCKLKEFGFAGSEIILVDDRPEALRANYGNLVPVRRYFGAADDNELSILGRFLPRLENVSDVRHVPKVYWRRMLPVEHPVRPQVTSPPIAARWVEPVKPPAWSVPGTTAASGA